MQTLEADYYEVIVTDDSKEGTASKLIENNYPWVKWIAGPKKGPAANRNNGVKHAKGNWLIFTDDDCLPTAGWLKAYKTAIESNKQFKVFEGLTDTDKPKEKFNQQAPVNLKGGNLWSCNFAIEKNFFEALGGFDEAFPYAVMEDTDFKNRILQETGILFLPDAKVVHPWRTVKAFNSYKKWLVAHKYYLKKNNTPIGLSYRWTRLKILTSKIYLLTKELAGFKFRGIGFYFERLWFNVLMLFIRA